MTSEISAAVPAGENEGLIAFDLSCTSCGYNLRGLRAGGLCPECANPIDRSLRGDLLIYADPAWLRRLHLGVRLMLWYVVLSIMMGVLGGIVGGLGLPLIIAMLPALAVGFVYVASVYCLTTQEPRISGSEESMTLRNVIRASALVSYAGSLIGVLSMFNGSQPIIEVCGTVLQGVGLVAVLGIFVYLRRFATRIPDEKLARSTRTVMWGLVASLLSIFAAGIVAAIAAPGPGPGVGPGAIVMGVMGLFGCAGGVAAIVFGIWYIVLLIRYRDAFKNAAEQSARDLAERRGERGSGARL